MTPPPDFAIAAAVDAAGRSLCAKSKRGAAVFRRACSTGCCERVLGIGWNAQPGPFVCTGSDACKAACGKLCVHAELRAIRAAIGNGWAGSLELVHAKVVDGQLVAGGGPSCWQCSREILDVGIAAVWLFEAVRITASDVTGDVVSAESGLLGTWRRYSAEEFHRATAAHHGLQLEVRR